MLCSQDNMPATQRMNMMQPILPCHIFTVLIPEKPTKGTSINRWRDFSSVTHICVISMLINAKQPVASAADAIFFFFLGLSNTKKKSSQSHHSPWQG